MAQHSQNDVNASFGKREILSFSRQHKFGVTLILANLLRFKTGCPAKFFKKMWECGNGHENVGKCGNFFLNVGIIEKM